MMAAAVIVLVYRSPMLYIAKKLLAKNPITRMRQIGIGELNRLAPSVNPTTSARISAAIPTRMKPSANGSKVLKRVAVSGMFIPQNRQASV